MKKNKLISIISLIVICFNLIACSYETTDVKTVVEEINKEEETEIFLSEKDKATFSSLVIASYNVMTKEKYTTEDLYYFVYNLLMKDEATNYKKRKASFGYLVPKEEVKKIIKDALDIDILADELQSFIKMHASEEGKAGEIFFPFSAGDGILKAYVSSTTRTSDDELKVYINTYYISDQRPDELRDRYIVEAIENKNSMFGYTIKSIKISKETKVKFEKITESSFLTESTGVKHEGIYVDDDINESAWVEGVEGLGKGEYILFEDEREQIVNGVVIANGYLKSDNTYENNAKVKSIQFEFSDGVIYKHEFNSCYYDKESKRNDLYEFIKFDKSVKTKEIKVKILDVYPGQKYEDTCITQIKFVN